MGKEKFWGKTASIDLHGCNDLIKNPEKIKEFVIKLCKEIDMERHGDVIIDRFGDGKLEGWSCLQFIETSSITCHFDEQMGETNRAFIDIFSCKDFDENKAVQFSKRFFDAKNFKIRCFIRD
ncbi:MAG: S-adenosylmethionine decarboxylase [Nanoarchaeota archaeon]|nr:S-adenosylmethionine decarboxylase [Nanoarchaeota archaeon]